MYMYIRLSVVKACTAHVQRLKDVLLHIFFISHSWVEVFHKTASQQGIGQVTIDTEKTTIRGYGTYNYVFQHMCTLHAAGVCYTLGDFKVYLHYLCECEWCTLQ